MKELPSIGNASYASSAINLVDMTVPTPQAIGWPAEVARGASTRRIQKAGAFMDAIREHAEEKTQMVISMRRVVQVYIADPDPRVPLADSLMYKGDEQLTDLTDQELYFELDIKSILSAHNEKRVKMVDKTVKDRTEYLEPVKVRDLKMVVVLIAQF